MTKKIMIYFGVFAFGVFLDALIVSLFHNEPEQTPPPPRQVNIDKLNEDVQSKIDSINRASDSAVIDILQKWRRGQADRFGKN